MVKITCMTCKYNCQQDSIINQSAQVGGINGGKKSIMKVMVGKSKRNWHLGQEDAGGW
jgi:MinD superfamily P-loop ATPase